MASTPELASSLPEQSGTRHGEVTTAWLGGEDPPPRSPAQPHLVGRFVVLERVGSGAMGQVLLAYDPKLLREVALKLVFTRSAGASARMLREAQALAQLSHPNVVSIYDVGEQDGSVFIAMEYVRGRTLRQWLEAEPRAWRAVVGVLRQAGLGLAAAHRAGLVHRDVKPDNILVADDGRVYIADFGLARADLLPAEPSSSGGAEVAGGSSRELAVPLTEVGTVVGTMAYMAPEQHSGTGADAASDQYALCVTLYEALFGERPFTGRRPAELVDAKLAGTVRVPARTAVPRVISRAVIRGLAPHPADRWPSLDALLDELGRDPRRARVRALVAVGSLVAVGGAFGARELERRRTEAVCAAEGAAIAEVWNDDARERVRAGLLATDTRAAALTAERVVPWLDEHAARWEASRTETCRDGRVRAQWSPALLERAQWCFDDRRNELEAFVGELAHADVEVVHLAVAAAASLTPAEECRDVDRLQRLPAPPIEQRDAMRAVRAGIARGWALAQAGRFDGGLAAAREALQGAEALAWPPLVAAARYRVAVGLSQTGELTAAESEAEAGFVEAVASGSWDVAVDASDQLVWTVGTQLGRHADALRWSRLRSAAVAHLDHVDELREARHLQRLASIHFATGDNAQARALDERALAILEARLGPEHPDVAAVVLSLASIHQAVGEFPEAKALYQRALELRERALGPDHPDVGQSLLGLAGLDNTLGDHATARQRLERALALFEGTHGPEHPATALALYHLGNLDATVGDFAAARPRFERAVTILERTTGPRNAETAKVLRSLANVHAITGDLATAKQLHERALAISESRLGRDHVDVATHLDDLANVEGMAGNLAQATALHERALAIVEAALGADSPRSLWILDNLAIDYTSTGRNADARRLLERALELKQRVFDARHPTVAYSLVGLGDLDLLEGRPADAARRYEQALAIQGEHPTPPHELAGTRFKLARALGPTDRPRALALAAAATAGLGPDVPGGEALRAEIDAWLAERPGE